MNKTRNEVLNLVYMAFYVALSLVLTYLNELFPIIQMPNGGSLEYAVIACFVASYHLGWVRGVIVSLLSWVIGTFFGLHYFFVGPMLIALDYVIPYGLLGLASLFPRIKLGNFTISNIYTGIVGCMFLKYASHVLAGVYFWFPAGEAAGSLGAWIYSAWTYNLAYNLLTLAVALIITPILIYSVRRLHTVKFVGIKD